MFRGGDNAPPRLGLSIQRAKFDMGKNLFTAMRDFVCRKTN
jgi:hypothetical protein